MNYSGQDDKFQRRALYKVFASLFLEEPSDEAIEGINELFGSELSDAPFEIREDYNKIFLSPGTKLSPYQSVHDFRPDTEPWLFSEPAESAQVFYAKAGLAMDDNLNLPPDHISAELFFMAYLVETDTGNMQMQFMQTHLINWIPEYCRKIQDAAATAFYREVAKLLRLFIMDDLSAMQGAC